MSTYKNLIGKDVNFLTTDPDNAQAEGQIWYNSTSDVFKDLIANRAWVSSGSMITARGLAGSGGTSTSAFVAAGYTTTIVANTEEYNGTGFSTGANVGTARSQTAGAGTETAGLIAGGFEPPSTGKTEEYNGTSWSEQNDMNIARRTMSGSAGTQTAALFFGGYRDITPAPNGTMNSTESYNGTSWTSESALNTAVWQNTGDGTQTAAVSVGGPPTQTEHYDGSSWTTNVAINTARLAAGAAGTTSNTLFYGGTTDGADTGLSAKTEEYDGTSWTEVADMAVARRGLGKAGEYNNAIAMGGLGPAKSNTEEFNNSVNVITAAAWASGGNLGTARYKISSANAAPQDAALGFGGRAASGDTARDLSEEYNGSSWSEGNNLNNATRGAVGAGTQTAGLRAGGFDGGPAEQDNTEEYNGTSWSNANDMPANMRLGAGCGTQTAAVAFGGLSSPLSNKAVEYDGTNWTVGGTMNTGRYYLAGFGIQTAAVAAGGDSKDDTEEYDGTSWTSVNDVTSGNTQGAAASGILTAGLFFGGTRTSVPANTNITLNYDGTNWSTTAAMSTARVALGGAGTNTAGLAFGGDGPPKLAATEEFTGATSALNIKTITTS